MPIRGVPQEGSVESDFTEEQHLLDSLLTQVDNNNIDAIIDTQKESLRRFEKTNEMLSNCCHLSEKRLERTRKDATQHKETILQMKADLESIFSRIRLFKRALSTKYPDVYKEVDSEFKARRINDQDE